MTTITVEEAQMELPRLIDRLGPGEEVLITRNDQTVARLIGDRPPRQPGNCEGMLTILSDDDDHLVDFAEYLP